MSENEKLNGADASEEESAEQSNELGERSRSEPDDGPFPEAAGDGKLMKRIVSLQRPTWELELLISGAVVFSLFQLPGRLRTWFEGLQPHTSSDVGMLPFMAFYFLTLIVICLAVAFSLHFVLRSIWVGLTGLRSVFPKGIDWDELDIGPVARSVYREMNPSLQAAEKQADRIASTIFAVLFALLMSFGGAFLLLMVPMMIVELLRVRLFPQVPTIVAFYAVIVVVLLPTSGVGLVDAWFKKDLARVEKHPRLFARAERVSRWMQRLFMAQLSSPVILTFSSRFSLKTVTGGMVASMFCAVAIFMGFFAMTSGFFGFDSYVYFPQRGGAQVLTPLHYEDQREPTETSRLPTLPSEVIDGPYLRVFIPFRVGRDAERVEERCPGLQAEKAEGFFLRRRLKPDDELANDRLLDCVKSAYVVRIDGAEPVGDWSFGQHATNGLKGLVLYVSTESLQTGRHEILIGRLPDSDESTYTLRASSKVHPGMAQEDGTRQEELAAEVGPAEPAESITSSMIESGVEEWVGEEDGAAVGVAVPEAVVLAYRDRFTILFWTTGA